MRREATVGRNRGARKGVLGAAAAVVIAAATPNAFADPLREAFSAAGITGPAAGALRDKSGVFAAQTILFDPVLNKVREGAAKGVAPEAIAAAATRLADRMIEASAFYPGAADAREKTPAVEAAAKALMSGAEPTAVEKTFETLSRSTIARAEWHRAFGAVASLALAGAGSGTAADVVSEAIAAELKPAEISAIPGRFADLASSGNDAASAARALLDEIKGGSGAKAAPEARDRTTIAPGLERDDKDREADPSAIRGSGKAKFKDKSKEKKTPPGKSK